ncbi:hypothetical protein [Aliarcobacter lanthieri]|uniref:hypothetical protein n=4 Tax=Aliarcobacter lanthieri TaxID=1355374 RepID=UPI00155D8AA4|nr:hypothetical protein [Aliarcobacter lanthieri]QKF58165.1 hypothetical protein ALANTH_0024 [Aliarcobacter lanthieri]
MEVLGIVKSMTEGTFYLKDSMGNTKELKIGDEIVKNDVVFGDKLNTASAKIDIELEGNDVVVVNQDNDQLFDTSLSTVTFGNEEVTFNKQSIDEILSAWNKAQNSIDDIETAAGDVTEQETNAGNEEAEDGGALRSKFSARDGDSTDVISDLRQASWTGGLDNQIENAPDDIFILPPVYTIIEGMEIVREGDEAQYVVKLVDAAGNPVIATQDTIIYVTYTNKTTQNGDTEYNHNSVIEVVIKAGTSETIFNIKTIDDYLADDGEIYNVAITGNNSTHFDMRNGDVNGDKTNVDTTILDNSNPDNPGLEDGGYGPEDTVYAIIEGTTTVNEGDTATYVVKLVDKDGNIVIPTKDTTVTVVYKDKTTDDGMDTNKYNGEKITVVIKANESSAEFEVKTIDDYLADDGEIYNVSIENVDDKGQFEKVQIGDINGNGKEVDTVIRDNTTDKPNEDSTVEVDMEKVILKIFAADKDGNPLKGANGEYLTVNEVAEGDDAYYVVLAFEPETKEFNDSTVLKEQGGTVEVETFDKTATGATQATTNDGTQDYVSKKEVVELGKAIKVETIDDYMADNDEQYGIKITDKTYEHPSTGAIYENVVTDKDSVTTTIKDNTTDKPNEDSTVEVDMEKVILKIFAADKDGNPLKGANGEYLTVNEVAEGDDAYYVVLAFEPETKEFNDSTVLKEQGGTVEVETFDKTATGATQATTNDGTQDYVSKKEVVELGKAIKVETIDDYMADNDEQYGIKITDKTYEHPSTGAIYENVVTDKDSVTTTIKDNTTDKPNEDSTVEVDMEKVILKIFAADKDGNPLKGANGEYLTVNEVAEGDDAYYVVLAFEPETKEFNDSTVLKEQGGTVEVETFDKTATGATQATTNDGTQDYVSKKEVVELGKAIKVETIDDYMADNDEQYGIKITDKTYEHPSTGAIYENVVTDKDSVTTTIKDNTTDKPNEDSTVEVDMEKVILKIFAADKDGNPLKGANGEYLTVNEVAEGDDAYYVVLAFEPETKEFNDSTVLKEQGGTVEVETFDKTATGATQATTNDGTQDYVSKKEVVELGKAIKVETIDDYMADNDEQYGIKITDKTYEHPSTGAIYENVVTDKDSVTTTIKDNTTDKPNEDSTVEVDMEKVILKIFAADKDGNPLKGANGEYLTVNEVAEGDDAYYVVLAFEPETKEFNDSTVLKEQGGTVEVETFDKTATGATQATTNDGTQDYVSKKEVVELGKAIKVETIDDYMADNDEQYGIKITDKTYEHPSTGAIYENVVTDKDSVTTTIKDNSDPINPGLEDGGYGPEDTVYVKIIGNAKTIEGGDLKHTVKLVDNNGKEVRIPENGEITVTLEYTFREGKSESGDYETQQITVVIPAGKTLSEVINKSKVDFDTEGTEVYEVKIVEVKETGSQQVFEKVDIHSTDNKVTDTILDGITLTDPKNAYVDEDNFYTNKNDGTNSTNKKSDISDTQSLGFIVPPNYEKEVGTFEVNFVGEPTVTVDGAPYELKSNGVDIKYEVNGNTIIGKAGNTKVFEIILSKDGKYTYKQYENIDHPKSGNVSTPEGKTEFNDKDNIDLNFQFNITTTSKNGQIVTSPDQGFKVTVNDSSPDSGERTEIVNEDGILTIVLSDEGFQKDPKDPSTKGQIEISNDGGVTYQTLSKDDSIDILENGQKIGTLTNNGNGTLKFEPVKDYSKYESNDDKSLPNFTYKVSDTDGDYAEGKINIQVKPVVDGTDINAKNVETFEDNKNTAEGKDSVSLGLKLPNIKDNEDKNGGAKGDHGERVGDLTLKFTNGKLVEGAKLLDKDGNPLTYEDGTEVVINTKDQVVKIVIVNEDGTLNEDFHHSDVKLDEPKTIYMTKEQYESIKINHAEDNDIDINITISTKTYEVDDDGKPLSNSQANGQGKTDSKDMTVIIKPVTDDINLSWDNDSLGKISNNGKTYTFNDIKEGDPTIDLKSLLTKTSGTEGDPKPDLDGSEHRVYTISGIPEGTIVTLGGQEAIANSKGIAIIIFNDANNKSDDPSFSMEFPGSYSGTVEGKITLSVIDKGFKSDGKTNEDKANWGEEKTAEVDFKVNVYPVANEATIKVGQPIGLEDAGRAGGNTKAKDGTITNPEKGIVLPIIVTSTDKDGSETFTVTIKDIPNGGAIFVKDTITGKDILVTYAKDGTPTINVWNNGTLEDYTGTSIVADKGSITIERYDNSTPPKFIPPHNAHGDFDLKVDAKTVDTAIIDGKPVISENTTAKDKVITVVVKDVADSVVGNDYNEVVVDLADGTPKEYNAVANEDEEIKLDSIFKDSTKLESYDKESEDLTIVIKNLPDGVILEGATDINGQYIFKASDIPNIKIITPPNYSGELNFDITYITTEKGEAGNPSKTHDSKKETDSINIFVKPTVDAGFKSNTITNEDSEQVIDGNSYYKLDLGIEHQNGDIDETLVSVTINEPTSGEYKLFIKNGDTFEAITFTNGKANIPLDDLGKVYVQAPENKHGDFKITGSFVAKDSQYEGKNINYKTEETKDFTHTLTVKPVTDKPTIEVKENTETTIKVPSGQEKTIEIPVKVTSADKDGSENITKIVISGIPKGVTISFGDAETDAEITVSEHNGIYTIIPKDGNYKLNDSDFKNITFNVTSGANFEHRDITITAYTKDAEGSKEESTSTIITLDKTHGTGGVIGEGPKLNIVLDESRDFKATEDTEFNFLDVFKIVAEDGRDGRTEINFKIDVGPNATIKGLDSYKNADGSYTIKGNRADIESVLANLKVVPNEDFNSNQDVDGISIKVEINGQEISTKIPVIPVTDEMTVNITPETDTNINENGEFSFNVEISNNADREFTNINEYYIVVNEHFEAGETAKGKLLLDGIELDYVEGKGYKLPDGIDPKDKLNFTYKSGENRHGTVDIKVVVENKETGATNSLTAEKEITIVVKPVASSKIEVERAKDGIEDKEMASAKLVVKDHDPSEKFESILIKVAPGVAVYYNGGKSMAMNLGDGSWLVPVNKDGTLPEIFFKGNEHLGGEVKFDATINVRDGDSKGTIEIRDNSVYIKEVADGVTIDPTKTGINANGLEWTSLNLNANMKDIDGSETMYFTLEGLNSSAQFRVVDKDGNITDLSSQAKFENGKWTIEGVEYKDINNIQITHDKSVSGVKVEAWTKDGEDISSKVSGEFDLSYKQNAVKDGILTLGKDVNINFDNIDKISDNIKEIDLGKDNGANKLSNIKLEDILGKEKEIIIKGGEGDKVSFKDSIGEDGKENKWTKTAGIGADEGYDIYTNSGDESLRVKVEQPISDGITN